MDCLKIKKDTVEQKLEFLLGQSGGFTTSEHRLYTLAVLCLQARSAEEEDNNSAANRKKSLKSSSVDGGKGNCSNTEDACQSKNRTNIIMDENHRCSSNKLVCDIEEGKKRGGESSRTTELEHADCRCSSNTSSPGQASLSVIGNPLQNNTSSGSSRDDGIIRTTANAESYQQSFNSDTLESPIVVNHICSSQTTTNCGCELFQPKKTLPAIFHQQTYSRWKSTQDMNWRIRLMRKKPTIYVQPLENFPEFIECFKYRWQGEERSSFFTFLRDFLGLFFMGVDVRLMKTKLIKEYGWKVKQRHHHKTNKEQLLVSDLYSNMTSAIPKDGFCLLGITWTDLYPTEELNFVLGEASSFHRSAAFCFGRYEPKAYVGDTAPPPIDSIHGDLIFRMIKLITHETCHLYGLSHCVFFDCSMNESTSMKEALNQPLFLCPVCLKKLQKACQFDLVQRYEAMLAFLKEVNGQYPSAFISKATTWLQHCLTYIRDPGQNPV